MSGIIHTHTPAPVRVAMVSVSEVGSVTVADEPYLGLKFQVGNTVAPHLIVWCDQEDGPMVVDGHEGEGNWQRIAGPATETPERWQQRIDRAVAEIRSRGDV